MKFLLILSVVALCAGAPMAPAANSIETEASKKAHSHGGGVMGNLARFFKSFQRESSKNQNLSMMGGLGPCALAPLRLGHSCA